MIAISQTSPGLVRAVSCDTDEKAWELSGKIQGLPCEPHGVVYSPNLHALLVADGNNTRVLVVNPDNGSIRQVVQLHADVGMVSELCLHNQQLIVRHSAGKKEKVSFYVLQ